MDDLQNEIAGRETGRQARFLPEDPRSAEAKRKAREARAFRSRLAELLADPVYRETYDRVRLSLGEAERAADAVLLELEAHLRDAEAHLQDIQDRAARLPDGTRVYRDAEGNVRREDGSVVDPVLVDTIIWRDGEPSYEEYMAQQDQLDALRAQHGDVAGYRGDLGAMRDRVEDPDDPPNLDELEGILADIEAGMPKVVKQKTGEPEAAQSAPKQLSANMLPDLGN